jgi:hypothetical protein
MNTYHKRKSFFPLGGFFETHGEFLKPASLRDAHYSLPPAPLPDTPLTRLGIGVMLIMRGPGGFLGGRVYDTMVSQIDLFPTICDLLHIPYPAWLQGTSLLSLMQGDIEQVHSAIFAEVTYHVAYEPQRAVRTNRWKYIRHFDHHLGPPTIPCCMVPSPHPAGPC